MTCGDPGTKSKARFCTNPSPEHGGTDCDGDATTEANCPAIVQCPVDGNWSEWAPWGDCVVTCGTGVVLRSRVCDSPGPQYGGTYCVGDNQEENDCPDIIQCPGIYVISKHFITSLADKRTRKI